MNTPTFGLRIKYFKESKQVDSPFGGKNTLYKFSVNGQEAVQFRWIKDFCNHTVLQQGEIDRAEAIDLENSGDHLIFNAKEANTNWVPE